jgi:UDP-N-acetylmuramate dehydrogenase
LADSWLASVPNVRRDEPLARHSWYGIGGPARFFLEVNDHHLLPGLLERVQREAVQLTVLGAGSNTLFADEGVSGLVIKISTNCLEVSELSVLVCAGNLMPWLASESAKRGLSGLEFGAGVPGTVGGSIFGNAGAFGSEVKDALVEVEGIDREGTSRKLSHAECEFAYRDSAFKSGAYQGIVITRATFKTVPGDPAAIREQIKRVQKHRRDTQPIEKRSLGSTFKNPPGDSAGRLIDAAGLKGKRIGAAQISEKHANFIVNLGGASAADVLALMAEMRARVRDRFGIELEPEVRLVGLKSPE